MAESIVAKSSIPWARRASMACSFVVPAGRACETTPSKTTFVARPSTFGAMTARATEAAVATRIAAIQLRWAVSSPIMRLNEGQNAFALPGGGPSCQPPDEARASAASSSSSGLVWVVGVLSWALMRGPPLRIGR